MKILIDINHPAHVHYYRNFIKIMEGKGHKFLIISRNKEIEHYLLRTYNIPFIDKGKGKKSLIGKLFNYFTNVGIILKHALKFNPDLLIGSPYSALVSKMIFKPHISFGDTDHAKLTLKLTNPFNNYMLTPSCFIGDLGKCHIRFDGYLELCYLHPNYFIQDETILDKMGIKADEKFVIMRFVSWNAQHDIGHTGLSNEMKERLVIELSKKAKVFITSECSLTDDLKKFQINIEPERIHNALYYSSLYIGEGATMASESAMLGTPAIYINSLTAGTLKEQEKYGLLFEYRNSEGLLDKALQLLDDPDLKSKFRAKQQKMLSEKIDVTAFMVWFVENYPNSAKQMKTNSLEIQNKFR